MKKTFILLLMAGLSLSLSAQSKYTLADVRNARSMIWFGLDFSQARFYGPFEEIVKVKDLYIPNWNGAFVTEKGMFGPGNDLKKLLGMSYVFIDLSVVTERNNAIAIEELFGNTDKDKMNWNEEKVAKMIKQYDPKEVDGIGLVLVVESFDKTTGMATVWVTYFDPAKKEVIRSRKYFGKMGGGPGGQAKHWNTAIVNILNELRKNSIY